VSDRAPIFSVIIDAKGVAIRKMEPRRREYRKARKSIILRQRDAIELFRKMKNRGSRFNGTYHFQFLDSAKTFAMLRLHALEDEVQDNLDRIEAYDGTAKAA
jgi:hypothetical protein